MSHNKLSIWNRISEDERLSIDVDNAASDILISLAKNDRIAALSVIDRMHEARRDYSGDTISIEQKDKRIAVTLMLSFEDSMGYCSVQISNPDKYQIGQNYCNVAELPETYIEKCRAKMSNEDLTVSDILDYPALGHRRIVAITRSNSIWTKFQLAKERRTTEWEELLTRMEPLIHRG